MAGDLVVDTAPSLAGPSLSEARPAAGHVALAAAQERFAQAAASGVFAKTYELAGFPVQLRFAGKRILRRLTRAFGHLERPMGSQPVLTVDLWDSATAATLPPRLPAADFDEAARGAVAYFAEGPVRALYQPALETLQMLDEEQNHAWFWAKNAESLPEWECATPIRHILHWWLARQGVQQLHAAAIGLPSGGVLVVGQGGSGKSTVALAGLAAGLLYAGDDYVAASVEGGPIAYSLFNSGKVEPHHLDRFPHLLSAERIEPETDPSAAPLDRDKTVVYLHESHATTTTASFPIRAIMIPRLVGRGDTRIGPVSAARALAALAPSTIVQLHTAGAPALTAMRKLVASVPAFDLALGANVEAAGSVIRDLLAELDLE